MTREEFDDEVSDLSSAEDFLNYFGVSFDQSVVHVNRLHVLQRFHDYLHQSAEALPEAVDPRREVYRRFLARAYQDFVVSNALTEKVFRVFHETHCGGNASGETFIPLDELTVRPRRD